QRILGIFGVWPNLWLAHLLQTFAFVQGFPIKIYIAKMNGECSIKQPVSTQLDFKGIAYREYGIGHFCAPNMVSFVLPIGNAFSPCDDDFPVPCRSIYDSMLLGSSMSWIDPFPVNSGMNDHRIASLCKRRGARYGAERLISCSSRSIITCHRHMIFHRTTTPSFRLAGSYWHHSRLIISFLE